MPRTHIHVRWAWWRICDSSVQVAEMIDSQNKSTGQTRLTSKLWVWLWDPVSMTKVENDQEDSEHQPWTSTHMFTHMYTHVYTHMHMRIYIYIHSHVYFFKYYPYRPDWHNFGLWIYNFSKPHQSLKKKSSFCCVILKYSVQAPWKHFHRIPKKKMLHSYFQIFGKNTFLNATENDRMRGNSSCKNLQQ